MARYTDASRERVRDAVDMADLVGSRVELRRSGTSRMTGLCPFHDERSPSFGIDPGQKVFYCFGCGEGGDLFRYVELTEGVDFKGALELLADRYGIELELDEEDPRAADRRRQRERLLELLERTAAYYVRVLWESDEARGAREYLQGRGLEERVLREFRVGYAPSAWDRVLVASRRAGFSDQELADAGLVSRAREGDRIYDRFRRRITFPLCDARGRVLGFGARAPRADQQPKYLNTARERRSSTRAATSSRPTWPGRTRRRPGQVVLAEGYTDVHRAAPGRAAQHGRAHGHGADRGPGRRAGAHWRRRRRCSRSTPTAPGRRRCCARRASRRAGALELRVVAAAGRAATPPTSSSSEGRGRARAGRASVPFVRFRVERELERGDTAVAEGKDRVVEALRPVFATARRPARCARSCSASSPTGSSLAPALVASWLERPAAPGAGRARRPARGRAQAAADGARASASRAPRGPSVPAPSRPRRRRGSRSTPPRAPSARSWPRRSHCPRPAPSSWRSSTRRRTSRRTSRAAPPRTCAAASTRPTRACAEDDGELRGLLAELTVRAADLRPSRAALEADALGLDLLRLERRITAARSEGAGDVAGLVARREELRHRRDLLIERAIGETQPAGR